MARESQQSTAAHAYARSLLELANENKSAESIGQELSALKAVLEENPTFRLYLADPAVGTTERHQTLSRIFKGKVSPLLYNLLGVMNEKGRLSIFGQVIDAYDELLKEQQGKIEVDLYVAQKLADAQREAVRQRVSAALKKDAIVREHVDESIIGGLVLRVGDKLIDASAKAQLRALREKLTSAPAN